MTSLLRLAFYGSIALFVAAVVRESREAHPQVPAPRTRRIADHSKAKGPARSARSRARG